MCLPFDALSQHLTTYLGFCYLGHGVSLHGCSSKAHPLHLILDTAYLLTDTPPDLECGDQGDIQVNVHILGISELKWTGMGEFNSDDHYIYYCGQESLRRNGVAIMVNKRV